MPFLPIEGAQSSADLSAHIEYYLEPSWALTVEDIINERETAFKPIPAVEPDFGYIKSRVWLRLRVKNKSENETDWRVYVRENFLQYYDVYIVRANGLIDHLEHHDPDTVFSNRSTPYPELVTPFKFDNGEAVTLYIAYWSGGSSHAALSLETAESFADIAVSRTSKNYLSYGIMMILILVAFFALVILRLKVFWAYLFYVACTLVYLVHIDGVAFQFFWPNYPRFNSNFTIVIGTIFVIATYHFARVFLQTERYHPRIDAFFRFMIFLTPLMTIPSAIIDPQFTKRFIIALIFLGILFGSMAGCLAALTRFRQVGFYLLAWACGILTAGLMNLRHNFGFEVTQDVEFDAIRLSIIVDAVMMGLGVADHYTQILKARRKETEDNLQIAQQNLKLNKRLYDLEEQFQLAGELVTSRDAQIRDTVHDIRQPLHALRLAVQNAVDGQTSTALDSSNIEATFQYLENLMSGHLNDMVLSPEERAATILVETQDETVSDLNLPNILHSIHEMFLPDAIGKGLEFRYVPTTQTVDVDPLVLMRVVSNLVSNAIKYTPTGRVLLGTRRNPEGISIEVHDTGIGMSTEEFERAKRRAIRLENEGVIADGQGYGLTIANEFANKQGWVLAQIKGRREGSSISLFLPYKKHA